MRIVFMGTPEFAVHCLDALVAADHDVVCVITQPDRPKGRGNKLAATPVKERAQALHLPVFQPATVKDEAFLTLIEGYQPEVIIVVAYGRILPQGILDLPRYGCLNVHASLLPKYRGAAPIQRAVLNGETETGVTIMQLDAGMDTGDMLSQATMPVGLKDTTGDMFDKLAHLGAELLVSTLEDIQAGRAVASKQDESLATYAPMLSKDDECLDFARSAFALHNQVRGLAPAPGAYTWWQGQRLKIRRSEPLLEAAKEGYSPGEIVEIGQNYFSVGTGEGLLKVYDVQPAGKKVMPAKDFLNGAGLALGSRLGVLDE